MYAVFEDGSRQYRVSEGQVVQVDHRDADLGARVEFPRVLLYRNADDLQIGEPALTGMRVVGEVVGHPSKKSVIQHYRRRKNSRRLRGHRQHYLAVRILHILLPGQDISAPAPELPAPAPEPPPAPSSETPPSETSAPASEEAAQTPPAPAAPSGEAPTPETPEAPTGEQQPAQESAEAPTPETPEAPTGEQQAAQESAEAPTPETPEAPTGEQQPAQESGQEEDRDKDSSSPSDPGS